MQLPSDNHETAPMRRLKAMTMASPDSRDMTSKEFGLDSKTENKRRNSQVKYRNSVFFGDDGLPRRVESGQAPAGAKRNMSIVANVNYSQNPMTGNQSQLNLPSDPLEAMKQLVAQLEAENDGVWRLTPSLEIMY
jgi:hypothetical protein